MHNARDRGRAALCPRRRDGREGAPLHPPPSAGTAAGAMGVGSPWEESPLHPPPSAGPFGGRRPPCAQAAATHARRSRDRLRAALGWPEFQASRERAPACAALVPPGAARSGSPLPPTLLTFGSFAVRMPNPGDFAGGRLLSWRGARRPGSRAHRLRPFCPPALCPVQAQDAILPPAAALHSSSGRSGPACRLRSQPSLSKVPRLPCARCAP